MLKFNLPPLRRIFFFLCVTALCLIAGSVIAAFILRGGMTTPRVRLVTLFQDIIMFIMPALATAIVITRRPADFLCLRKGPGLRNILLVTATILGAVPAMNLIIRWNQSISLPSSIKDLVVLYEERANSMIQIMTGEPTVGSLIVLLFLVALFAGFSEELFFRGTMQRLLSTGGLRAHAAVWITAAIFTTVHFQFYGFVPRLLLGAYFGYLIIWTGSLWPAVWAHILNNALAACSIWNEARGARFLESVPGYDEAYTGLTPAVISAVCTVFLLYLTVKVNRTGKED